MTESLANFERHPNSFGWIALANGSWIYSNVPNVQSQIASESGQTHARCAISTLHSKVCDHRSEPFGFCVVWQADLL